MGQAHSTNFTECGQTYMHSQSLIDRYGYEGRVIGIPYNKSVQISFEGCRTLCGHGNDYHNWNLLSGTITTWIFPIIGILLQAPFESNALWRTVLALTRWIGSPIATLSYILWNIQVSGKCAMIVDMATRFEDPVPGPDSDFASIRDSLYILMTMNQFSMKAKASVKKETEGLLRVVLFSKDLKLPKTDETLKDVRHRYAEDLRASRKRGVVPVFISTMWFLISLAISIQTAFGDDRQNNTAHNLALGLLLAWLPVLILCSIIDRNPTTSDNVRRKLNKLVDKVRNSLMDPVLREQYIDTFRNRGNPKFEELGDWITKISDQAIHMEDFFTDFAGQGRVRWHYGAAHPILSDIERCYVAEHGRDWLRDEDEARSELVLGETNRGLLWFDTREAWQILAAILIVVLTVLGAFFLSFFTPPVGIGCRSGGYTIFVTIAVGLMVCEMLVWWLTSSTSAKQDDSLFGRLKACARSINLEVEKHTIKRLASVATYCCPSRSGTIESFRSKTCATLHSWHRRSSTRLVAELLFFRPLEIVNTTWLVYIILAEITGAFQNCVCLTNAWGTGGGYFDFTRPPWSTTNSHWARWYWTCGTVIATTAMGFGMVYVVVQWCLQSHLSSEDYDRARRGLARTRWFRQATEPILNFPITIYTFVRRRLRKSSRGRECHGGSLKWTKNVTYDAHERYTSTAETTFGHEMEDCITESPEQGLECRRSSGSTTLTRIQSEPGEESGSTMSVGAKFVVS